MGSEREIQKSNYNNKDKTSTLNQTKQRYFQVIQDLTKDHPSVLQEKDQNSNSLLKPVSKSCSSIDQYNGNNSSNIEETPEEIRQYVKQFKAEVEEKFQKSEANKSYVFPKFNKYFDKGMNGQVDDDASLDSLQYIHRYDLNSQNIKKKYGSTKLQNGITESCNDTGQLADILHDIGQQDKQFQESQLRDNKSNIQKILCNTLRKKIIDTEKSQDSIHENQLQLQSQKNINYVNYGNFNSSNKLDNIDTKTDKMEKNSYSNYNSSRTKNSNKENKVIDYENRSREKGFEEPQKSPKKPKNLYDYVEEQHPELHQYHESHGPRSSNHKQHNIAKLEKKSNNQAGQRSLDKIKKEHVYTEGNYPATYNNYQGSSSSKEIQDSNDTEEAMEFQKNKTKIVGNVPINSNMKTYQSPRKKTSTTGQSRESNPNNKRINQVNSRVKAHYYNKNVISPQRTHQQSNCKPNNLSKKSNLTIFTNNTLTSTLSPKSNLSLSTFKSTSRGKISKGLHTQQSANKKSLLQFQVGSSIINKIKKMEDRQSCMGPQVLNGPIKSRIASKITAKILKPNKKQGSNSGSIINPGSQSTNPILTICDVKSINTSTKNSRYSSKSRRLIGGGNEFASNVIKNNMNGSSSHLVKDNSGNLAYKVNYGYMNKKSSERENNKGKAMLNKLLPTTHQKNILSLSSVNWRRRLENLT